MSALRKSAAAGHRNPMLAKVHLAAKELGLEEETRRDLMERVVGQRSAAGLSDAQLAKVLDEYKRLGWKPTTAGAGAQSRGKPADSPMARKARAMWISLWNLGVVRSATEKALEAFGARQLGVDRLQWADQGQGYRLIEALKAMAERAGWSHDMAMVKADRQVWCLKARLVQAQARALGRPALNIAGMAERDLDRVANELGVEIRQKMSVHPTPNDGGA